MTYKKLIILSVLTYIIPFLIGIFYVEDMTINPLNYNLNNVDYHSNINSKETIFKSIFLNNLKVNVINIIGCISLGLFSFILTAYNGFVIGYMIKTALKLTGLKFLIISFLPHSFEIIGIIFSCYLGYSFSNKIFIFLFEDENKFKINDFYNILICFTITFIAALTETYITIQ